MPSQNNAGLQHNKTHAITQVATAAITANRLVDYRAKQAVQPAEWGPLDDCQGVSESDAAVGEAFAVVTAYSYLVEAGAPIAFGDYIKPAADGTGRAVVGTIADHCGRALGAATGVGKLFEMQIVKHVHG